LTVNHNSRIIERMTNDEFLRLLRAECEKAGSQAKWAAARGISPSYLSDVLQGRREAGGKILDALGYKRVVSYEEAKEGGDGGT
jgi:hypothetical protein